MSQSLSRITLLVSDYDEAIAYFTQVLRFQLIEDTPRGEGKRWVRIAPTNSDSSVTLLLAKAANEQQRARVGNQFGGRVGFFLETDDFAGDYAHMQAHGVRFAETPRKEPYGDVVVFEDLCGNRWDLIQRQPEAKT